MKNSRLATGGCDQSGPGCELTIKYPARRTPRGNERRVVYVRYGAPPVTTAEIEIMRQHLEALERDSASEHAVEP